MTFQKETFLLLIVFFVFFSSCKKDKIIAGKTEKEILEEVLTIPDQPYNYASQNVPAFFNNQFIKIQNNTPADNPVTDWGGTLGRVLFYDKTLSGNSSTSCASCHKQEFGFTDTARLSTGFNGGSTGRHSMSLINATFYSRGRFFWDERAATLEDQVLMPIQSKVEMGMTLDTLVNRLQRTSYYPILFKYAFSSSTITSQNISKALAQFVRSLISFQSKYDEGLAAAPGRNVDFANFTAEENLGKKIFNTNTEVNCSGCHFSDVFIMDSPRNIGLSTVNPDDGSFINTQDPLDKGKFKVPSLKNVALRQNYMHDGSIRGLDAVLNHYNILIQPNPNLDFHLKDIHGNPAVMNLNAAELAALQSFLETLTDNVIIKDIKFSTPFR